MVFVRHKVFISYHHDDQNEVNDFVTTFDEERNVFIARALGTEMDPDIINSDNPDYVMGRIRDLYLKDSTVTIVLIGKCTWSRKFVDWEIQSSLRSGVFTTPNGLLGILLKSRTSAIVPERLRLNLPTDNTKDSYARYHSYPTRKDVLAAWIDDAFNARTTRKSLIENPRERFINNKSC